MQSARYPPEGRRGAAFGVAHDDYVGGDLAEKVRVANRELLLIAQVETAAGVENAEEIGAVDGIDVLWIGHYDLTASLGIPGQTDPRGNGHCQRDPQPQRRGLPARARAGVAWPRCRHLAAIRRYSPAACSMIS